MNIIDLIKYTLIGLIQGITELLPISSSGHVVFYSHLFKMDLNLLTYFLIITNFGSFIALFIHYKKDIFELFKSLFSFIFIKNKRNDLNIKDDMSYILKLLLAVIPISIIGLLYRDFIPTNLLSVGISFLVTSIFLMILYLTRNKIIEKELTYQKSLIYGLMHMAAIIPGISRSGTGFFSGLIQGVEIKKTIKFTFLIFIIISIPVTILGAIDLYKSNIDLNITYLVIAFVTSFLGTYLFVNLIHKVITFNNFKYFSVYIFIMGIISIILYNVL